jgi:hypothetical protein
MIIAVQTWKAENADEWVRVLQFHYFHSSYDTLFVPCSHTKLASRMDGSLKTLPISNTLTSAARYTYMRQQQFFFRDTFQGTHEHFVSN